MFLYIAIKPDRQPSSKTITAMITILLNSKVIASESEDAENQVVLKATIYQMRHSSPEGASLFINHHGADSDVHRRALLVLPPR
jgi:HJR/Mrr/RecB family endonuclease